MNTRAIRQTFGTVPTYRYGVDTYAASGLGLGPLIYQYSGSGENNFVGPSPIGLARPMEQSTPIAAQYPWAMQWQNNAAGEMDWVFLADLAGAAATRRIVAYTYNRRTSVFTWLGFVTVTYPLSVAKTIRAQRMTYDLESTGTVSVSGTAVTGISTLFSTNAVCVGNRIGFGSTDPTLISTWYEISAIGSNTSITLTTTATTLPTGTAYVIEDLRCVQLTTDSTTTDGGLFVIKGLRIELFSSIGGTVPAAVSTDNIRACYWLKDAASITNTVGIGLGMSVRTSPTSHMVYTLDTIANPVCFKYNIRAALTLSSGGDTTNFQFKTGSGGVITGTPTQLNNARIATLGHGAFSGVEALYFTTSTRIYGCTTSSIINGSTTWLSAGAVMTENPPGGIATFAATAAISTVDYADTIDKLIVITSATGRNYVTIFRTDAGQMSRIWGINTNQIDESTVDATAPPIPSQTGGAYTVWEQAGLLYVATTGTTAVTNRLYAMPLGADWEYASTTKCEVILPQMTTIGINNIISFFAQQAQVIGGATGTNLGLNTEPFRMYYRTSGISNDSGSWTLLDNTGTAAIAGASTVQLMIQFRTIGTLCLPARICQAGMLYSDTGMSNYWQGSTNVGTNLASKQFGFRQSTAYGTTVPRLNVLLYDAEAGTFLGSDDSVTQAWTWEKSTNSGVGWGSYNTTDRTNANTYVRITPVSLADNIKVLAVLTEY